jgi:hypothetical protein
MDSGIWESCVARFALAQVLHYLLDLMHASLHIQEIDLS